jgi:4a-hydroxytetrahydrobiopterin dehydratase
MKNLTSEKCIPCEGGMEPMKPEEYEVYLPQVEGWEIEPRKSLFRKFKFKNFKESLEFINKVGEIAEAEGHHPDLSLHNWNKVDVTLSTHAINGLSINDFIIAAKINRL